MSKHFGTVDELFESTHFTKEEEEEIDREVKFISKLIKAREKAKVSQMELSRRTKVAQSTIARIENRNVSANISTIMKYLDTIGYELDIVKKKK